MDKGGLTIEEAYRRLEGLERRETERDKTIRENREGEVNEHTAIRKEMAAGFDRIEGRLWTILAGLMTTVLISGAFQYLTGG